MLAGWISFSPLLKFLSSGVVEMPFAWRLERAIDDGELTPPEFAKFKLLDGRVFWQAQCRRVTPVSQGASLRLYESGLYEGAAPSKFIAARKALCEGLERWAYHASRASAERSRYGFDKNDSTDGMAAYPGIIRNRARMHAYSEALERWAIQHWWAGLTSAAELKLKAPMSGIRVNVRSPLQVVILWTDSPVRTYGFACSDTLQGALDRALVELSRNVDVLEWFKKSSTEEPTALLERRLLHFSAPDGIRAFEDRVSRSVSAPRKEIELPRIRVDAEVKGAWSRYVRVWRVDFERDSRALDNGELEWFCF